MEAVHRPFDRHDVLVAEGTVGQGVSRRGEVGSRRGRAAERARIVGWDEELRLANEPSGDGRVEVDVLLEQPDQGPVPGRGDGAGAVQGRDRVQGAAVERPTLGEHRGAGVESREGGGRRRGGVMHSPSIEHVFEYRQRLFVVT